MKEFLVETSKEGFIDITEHIKNYTCCSKIKNGICQVFIPHTTAAVTINENADPDVVTDLMSALKNITPKLPYRHVEGNSPAHVMSSLVGCSITIPVEQGHLVLGTWQGIYFCEFDGPRKRKVQVQIIGI
ncbi:MAG: secondary thiamine-phosphate synthase enzyme YjbQ [Acidaminococcaceae bacterium]